jgi:hypothetical protein
MTARHYLSKNVFDGTRPLTPEHAKRLRKLARARLMTAEERAEMEALTRQANAEFDRLLRQRNK